MVSNENTLELVDGSVGLQHRKEVVKNAPWNSYFLLEAYVQPDPDIDGAQCGTAFLTDLVRLENDVEYAIFLTAGHALFGFHRVVLKHPSDLLKDGDNAYASSAEPFIEVQKPFNKRKGWFEVSTRFESRKDFFGHNDYGAIFVEKRLLEMVTDQRGMSLDDCRLQVQPSALIHLPEEKPVFVAGFLSRPEIIDRDYTCLATSEGNYLRRESLPTRFIKDAFSKHFVALPAVDLHTADAHAGMSGSPVVIGEIPRVLDRPDALFQVIGLHLGGLAVDGKRYVWLPHAPESLKRGQGVNFVRRLTQDMLDDLRVQPAHQRAGMSEQTWWSYQKALKGGVQTVLHQRVIVCGAARVGKSSFCRSLHDQPFKANSDSTVGVELHKVVCIAKKDTKTKMWTWQKVNDEDEQQLLCATKALMEHMAARPQVQDDEDQGKSSQPQTSFTEALDPANTNNLDFVEGYSHTRDTSLQGLQRMDDAKSSATTQQISESCDNASVIIRQHLSTLSQSKSNFVASSDDLCFVDLWDFAGQEVFIVIQHLLLAQLRCAYVAMFDAKQSLNEQAKHHIGQDGVEYEVYSSPDETNFDKLESWLNAIHLVAQGRSDVPTYVVASHADETTDLRKEQISSDLRRKMKGKPYYKQVDNVLRPVFVNNKLSGSGRVDANVQKLRNQLIEEMLKQREMKLPIPLAWLPFTLIARLLAKKNGQHWLTMDEVKLIAVQGCKMPPADDDQITNMLQFHHALGHVLHYPENPNLRDRVIINVGWLLPVVSLIFMQQPEETRLKEKHFREHYDLLYEQGILRESLAKHIWEQRDVVEHNDCWYLFNMMASLSLLYDADDEASFDGSNPERYFYVPAVVTRVKDLRLAASMEDGVDVSPPLFLYSDRVFPQSLFWSLVVRMIRKYSFSKHEPTLYQNSAEIVCRNCFQIVLDFFPQGIKITVEHEDNGSGAEGMSMKQFCGELLPFIEQQLSEVQRDTLKTFQYDCCVQCPCSLNKQVCTKHKQPNCRHPSCVHFVVFTGGDAVRCSDPNGRRRPQNVQQTISIWPIRKLEDTMNKWNVQDGRVAAAEDPSGSGITTTAQVNEEEVDKRKENKLATRRSAPMDKSAWRNISAGEALERRQPASAMEPMRSLSLSTISDGPSCVASLRSQQPSREVEDCDLLSAHHSPDRKRCYSNSTSPTSPPQKHSDGQRLSFSQSASPWHSPKHSDRRRQSSSELPERDRRGKRHKDKCRKSRQRHETHDQDATEKKRSDNWGVSEHWRERRIERDQIFKLEKTSATQEWHRIARRLRKGSLPSDEYAFTTASISAIRKRNEDRDTDCLFDLVETWTAMEPCHNAGLFHDAMVAVGLGRDADCIFLNP